MKCNELLRELTRLGWYKVRQTGSHIILQHDGRNDFITFPNHGSKELSKGVEKSIKKQAGII